MALINAIVEHACILIKPNIKNLFDCEDYALKILKYS